jgi:two-component system nitrate/nitrite response regulator NarL
MSIIDVALVGGSTLHREGLRQSLDPNHFVVVAEGRDFGSLLPLMGKEEACPRLIIADVSRMSEKDFEALRQIRDEVPECRIVVLTNDLNLTDLGRVFRAGADGYLVSDLSREAFSLSLLVIMSGEKMLPGVLADVLASNYRDFVTSGLSNDEINLTEREREILRCLLNGHSNKLIARVLDITEGTVKVHLKTLMKKISAVNRTQAALWARSQGIGEDPDPLKSRRVSTMPAGGPLSIAGPLLGDVSRSCNGNREPEIGVITKGSGHRA